MKLSSGKRIGQSGGELAAAAVLSFILHVVFFAATLLYLHANPKKYTPPFYDVKLVGQPAEAPELPKAPLVASQPAPPKQEAKAAPKAKKAAPKTFKAQAKKGAMPELAKPLQKPVPAEPVKPEEPLKEQPTAPVAKTPPGGTAGPVAKVQGVGMPTPQQDFKYAYYLDQVRDQIGQNWRPPEASKNVKARVIFTINRSGVVLAVDLDKENSDGNFWFNQAAMRAVQLSRFPRLPEDFSRQTLQFTVDLMAK